MDRWVEHYSVLYYRENVSSVLDSIVPLPVLEKLDTDPTQEELCKAINSLTCGKAPGNNGIPSDFIKCCKNTLLQPLLDILCHCWRERTLQDTKAAKIVTLQEQG